ncbi:MAG TPA: zinc-binding alcohol dehydrogenase [Anaerolineales bacterium]|jgi:2-desacetyl-2-hydroxyethyl bacteriochlorophyllide A dehydrogenase
MTSCKNLYFSAPHQVEIREEELPHPTEGQVRVRTVFSAISSGTEMLVYRGQFPELQVDTSIEALRGNFAYPLAYGYACVGQVVEVGGGVQADWLGRMVFSFQPHCSYFLASPQNLLPVPEGVTAEQACFLPNMETAVNLVQDAAPILGERVLVLGQGIIGLLTTGLLSDFPLESLVCADLFPKRREASQALGASAVLDPAEPTFDAQARVYLKAGADLTLELSGAPAALNEALALTTFSGRIVIGSWYGSKRTTIDLGGSFHRSRIRLISSQVSSIAPELSARWDKSRRFGVAWQALVRLCPEKWITQRVPFEQAAEAYQLLDESPAEAIQVILKY